MKGYRPVKKGNTYELDIECIGVKGEGVGRIEGFAVFIADALPGDRVEAEMTQVKKSYAKGRLKRIIKRSSQRIQPICPVAFQCGGCQIQHLNYDWQLRHKRQRVIDDLTRIGGLKGITVHPVIGMEWPWRYRNKAQIPIGKGSDGIITGFYEKQSHKIIDTDDCIIQHGIVGQVMKIIKEHAVEHNIQPYDEKTGDGIIRHILTRVGFYSGEVMVVIVAAHRYLPKERELIRKLRDTINGIMSIILNINDGRTNVILGRECITLWGRDYITEIMGDLKFRISPLTFFQVNPAQTLVLYNKVLEYAGLKSYETVIDAYCGAGSISLFLARKARKVYGIEIVDAAIKDAGINAEINGIGNTEFILGLAEEVMPRLYGEGLRPDVVVLDPPRKGCEENLLDAMVSMGPKRVVYVSCNPSTLARDLKYLENRNYRILEAQPIDLFPHTTHVETVVSLSHKKADTHININVEFGDDKGQIPIDEIARKAEEYRPSEKVTYKMIQEYIESKYNFKVHTAYIAEVKRDLGLPMYDAPNAVEELKHERKHPTPEKVEAIKDALRHFGVIQ